jgi:hypothetical protein
MWQAGGFFIVIKQWLYIIRQCRQPRLAMSLCRLLVGGGSTTASAWRGESVF